MQFRGGGPIIFLLSMLTAIAGTIVSGVGFSQIKKAPDSYSKRGMALAGLIIGALMLVLQVAMIIAILSYLGG